MTAAAAFLALAALAAAVEPSAVVSGVALSIGPGYRVTAPLTLDRAKAARGGFVFATPAATPADDAPIRLSEAVLTGRSGAFGPAGTLSRRHGVPALSLPGARWERGALVLRLPVFGPAGKDGVQPVERFEDRRLSEGAAVSVDPENGLLVVIDPAQSAFELDLAQALRGFDGLRDLQGLLQWYDSRTQDGPSPALAARLVEELTARVAAGTASPEELARLRRAVETGLDAQGRALVAEAAARAAEAKLRALSDRLDDLTQEAPDAGSPQAAERLAAEGRRASASAKSVAAAVGKPALAAGVERAAKKLAEAARKGGASRRGVSPAEALAAAGASRPAGEEVPPADYERFVAETGLAPLLEQTADDASLDLRRKDERLAALFSSARLSADSGVGREIISRLPPGARLSVCGPEGCEPEVPRAGALAAVKDAWSRSWSGAALGRRKRAGKPFVAPALRLEARPPAEVSGLAWSRDPVGGSPRRLVVEAAFGDPAALESGQASGDEYALDSRTLAPALPAVVVEKKGAEPPRSLLPALTQAQAAKVARAARALDGALGEGVRLTFAFSGGKLYVLGWQSLSGR